MNFSLEADIPYTIADTAHPIMQGMSNFTINDEAFFLMTWAKSPRSSARDGDDGRDAEREGQMVKSSRRSGPTSGTIGGGQQPFRAFVWMQGHNYANFADPRFSR